MDVTLELDMRKCCDTHHLLLEPPTTLREWFQPLDTLLRSSHESLLNRPNAALQFHLYDVI